MAKTYIQVFNNPVEGKDAEYNAWFDNIHMGEILRVKGVKTGQRFTLATDQVNDDLQPFKYYTQFEIDGDDVRGTLTRLADARKTMHMEPVVDASTMKVAVFRAITDVIHKPPQSIPKPDFLTDEQWAWVLSSRPAEKQKELARKDVELYLKTGGRSEAEDTLNMQTLLLTVVGRKSGKELTTPVLYIRDGDNLVIVGSKAGLPDEPSWALNLRKTPLAWVQIHERKWAVNARIANGEQRSRLWAQIVQQFPLWGHFQKYCEREFPVFILSAAEKVSSGA